VNTTESTLKILTHTISFSYFALAFCWSTKLLFSMAAFHRLSLVQASLAERRALSGHLSNISKYKDEKVDGESINTKNTNRCARYNQCNSGESEC
jgi:hypothetical protein